MALSNGPNLGLLVDGAAGDIHLTALLLRWRWLDLLIKPVVLSRSQQNPPGSPSDGDSYIIPPDNIGWGGSAGQLARWTALGAGAWEYLTPHAGWVVYVRDAENIQVEFDGTRWNRMYSRAPFEIREAAISGLTFGFYGGFINGVNLGASAVSLVDAATNYLSLSRFAPGGGVVVTQTLDHWNNTHDWIKLYSIATSGVGTISSIEDHRYDRGGLFSPFEDGEVIMPSDVAVSTTALANLTGLLLQLDVGTYEVDIVGVFQSAATTTGMAVALDVPAGSTVVGQNLHPLSNALPAGSSQRADAASLGVSTGVDAANADILFQGKWIVVTTTAGDCQAMLRSEIAASAITMRGTRTRMRVRRLA